MGGTSYGTVETLVEITHSANERREPERGKSYSLNVNSKGMGSFSRLLLTMFVVYAHALAPVRNRLYASISHWSSAS